MALAITAASTAAHPPTSPVPSTAQKRAALNGLLTKYAYGQLHGADAATLSAIRNQILADAKILGQHVSLPSAPVALTVGSVPSSMSAAQAGRVHVTA